MGGSTSSDQISISAQRMIRVAETSIDMKEWNRAKVAITALCQAKIKITYQKACANCKILKDSDENVNFYSCCHQYCLSCLDVILSTSIETREYKCPNCTEGVAKINSILQYKARFGDKLSNTLLEKVDFYIKKHGVICSVCLLSFKQPKDLYLTNCGHHICLSCLEMDAVNQINQSEPYIKLPCRHSILHQNQVRKIVSAADFQRFLKFSMRSQNIGTIGQDEVFIFCQNAFCGENEGGLMGFVTPKSVEVALCPNCYTQHCPKCTQLLKQDHQCMGESEQLEEIKQQIQKGKLQKCPKCGILYSHGGGCYYVTCSSARCNGKTSFCFICGKLLINQSLHFDHFPDGPFTRYCNTLANLPDPQYY